MVSTPWDRAIAYCEQALQSCSTALAWLRRAGIDAPLYLGTINGISAAVAVISAMVSNLVAVISNQESGNVISPLSTVTNVNMSLVGLTNLYVVPAGQGFVPLFYFLRNNSVAPAGTSIIQLVRLSDGAGLDNGPFGPLGVPNPEVGQVWEPTYGNGFTPPIVAAGDTIALNVSVADTNPGVLFDVDLFGYLV